MIVTIKQLIKLTFKAILVFYTAAYCISYCSNYVTIDQNQSVNFSVPWLTSKNKPLFPNHPLFRNGFEHASYVVLGRGDGIDNAKYVLMQNGFHEELETNIKKARLVYYWNYNRTQFSQLKQLLKENMQPWKKFSFVPGIEKISFKKNLAKSGYPWTAPGYFIPEDLKELQNYAAKYPEKRFISKDEMHSKISRVLPSQFHKVPVSSFVQELIGPPFLIQGHKFDMSKSVIIASVDPFRVYISESIFVRTFRFKYDPDDFVKYPHLSANISLMTGGEKRSRRGIFDFYMIYKRNVDPMVIHKQMNDIIVKTLEDIHGHLVRESIAIGAGKGQLYQRLRFDFLLTEDLLVHLIEVNDSAYLGIIKPKKVDRMRSLRSTEFNLAGVTNWTKTDNPNLEQLKISSKGCTECLDNCFPFKCRLCPQCISEEDLLDIVITWKEQENRSTYKRGIPNTSDCDYNKSKQSVLKIWLCMMCREDTEWCDINDLKSFQNV